MIAFGISSKASVQYSARLEYLESTGTQYIDTGHKPTANTTIETILAVTATDSNIRYLFGSAVNNGSEGACCMACYVSNSFTYFSMIVKNGRINYLGNIDGGLKTIRLVNNGSQTSYAQVDEKIGTSTGEDYSAFEIAEPIVIFGTRRIVSAQNIDDIFGIPSNVRISSFSIYESGTLVQDLIPVIDNNGVACMYDNVSKQCFYNQGTGEFVAGPAVEKQYLKFTAEEANSTISMSANGSAPTVYLETSTTGDDGSWSDFTVGSTTITLANVGDKIYFRAKQDNNIFSTGANIYNKFVMTGKIAASGNINTLLKADGSVIDLTGRNYCYAYMFYNCTSLTQAPELPAETLEKRCYQNMFSGCTSLTQAPELPATTLATYCYFNMFQGCTSLTQAPELPATTLATYCYHSMFINCTSLTQAPELPAETLVSGCYTRMFYGCTNLNNINVNFSDWNPTNATTSWVYNVSSGTFTCPEGLPEEFGTSKIPTGWTVVRK